MNSKIAINQYFAHINSAKCCENNPNNKEASTTLFKNCRAYLKKEIEIINTDVIITQGQQAKKVINTHYQCKCKQSNNLLQVTFGKSQSVKALWFHTPHPNTYGQYSQTKKKATKQNDYDIWVDGIKTWFLGKTT